MYIKKMNPQILKAKYFSCIIYLCCLSLIFNACRQNEEANFKAYTSLCLSDSSWQIQTPEGEYWQVKVPGNNYTDLWQANKIKAPFEGDNELKYKAIENKDFSYNCHFSLSNTQLALTYHQLVFNGLDTYATVSLNDSIILQSKNMFRTYKIEVADLLQTNNHLKINFRSAIQAADSLYEAYPLPLPADNDRNPKATSVFTRKAPYQYGWDWGPRYVGQGIWQPIYLHSSRSIQIHSHRLWQVDLNDDKARVGIQLDFTAEDKQELQLQITQENRICLHTNLKATKGKNNFQHSFTIADIERWYPNGMGNPRLYPFKISIYKQDSLLWENTQKIGFRHIQLQRQTDSIGESFSFYVNGQAVYAKGANYIPQDVFPTEVKPTQYRRLLQQAKEAHFNMIRVWGGGIYEQDLFYHLCDSLGLMVWQDFMFACSLYPADSNFLQEVKTEAQQQIVRLRDHACMALWCGNNEINELWHNWGYQKKYGYSSADSAWLWHNYQRLFQELLPQMVQTYDSTRYYLESSPVFGWGHKESMTHGDSHYWGVWWGKQDFEEYAKKTPRFSSEFGFQSIPALNTILSFTDSSQLELYSIHLKAHQKSSIGNQTIMDYIVRYFPKPHNFNELIYISQLTQAYGLHMAFAAQRQAKPHCMGTLFWQLNDCWPAISWSAIDYHGQQKALYYTAKRDFNTFMLNCQTNAEQIEIKMVSDSLYPCTAKLQYAITDMQGNAIYSQNKEIKIEANSAQTYAYINRKELLNINPSKHYIHCQLWHNNILLAENYHFLAKPKDLALAPTNLQLKATSKPNIFTIENKGEHFAYGVYLSCATFGNFSNNFFHLPAGKKQMILFQPIDNKKVIKEEQISIQHLRTK